MAKEKEGIDSFNLHLLGYDWRAPTNGSESFVYQETSFYWDNESQSLTYPYGAAQIVLEISYDKGEPGFLGRIGRGNQIAAKVNGISMVWNTTNTKDIKDSDLRVAVVLGLRAWQTQLGKSTAEAFSALKKQP